MKVKKVKKILVISTNKRGRGRRERERERERENGQIEKIITLLFDPRFKTATALFN